MKTTKECVYCKCKISDDRAIDVCDRCGERVWGNRMFNAIKKNMDNAKDNGDLCHMNNTFESTEKEKQGKF